MGRGRAKAKQTKVARELKYRSFGTDFSSLEQELRSGSDGAYVPPAYADLSEDDPSEVDDTSTEDEGYEDLRKSG
ncbi:MAG TPA: DUF3073 domain-containing protein [Propionibacteriaceae bacterium]